MSAQHTPGPWYWHTDSEGRVSLRTPDRGNLIVMDCARKGMRGGAPRFAMWDNITEGAPRMRRGGLLMDGAPSVLACHPDARVIAAAPELLAELQSLLKLVRSMDCANDEEKPSEEEYQAALASAGVLIAKAAGAAS